MDIKVAKLIVESAEENNVDLTLYEDYSGRGMFGKETAGIVGSDTTIMLAVAIAARNLLNPEFDQLIQEIKNIRTDSLGRDTIYY